MFGYNSRCTIEQIYDLLIAIDDLNSTQQFEKIKALLITLHTRGKDGFSAEKPYKYTLHFNGRYVKLNGYDAPKFTYKTEFLAWLFKKLKVDEI